MPLLYLICHKRPLVPSGLLLIDNCCARDWHSDGCGGCCGDRQVVLKAAVVKKAIV